MPPDWTVAPDIGERLADLRQFLGLTQERFAELFGRQRKQVSNWETGRQEPAPAVLERAARQHDWPLEMFGKGGELPSVALRGKPARKLAVVREPGQVYGAPARDTIDLHDVRSFAPEKVRRFLELELTDTSTRGEVMAPERILWWFDRAFEAGARVAQSEKPRRRGRS